MIEIKKNIFFSGIRDWDLRLFHGHELSTHRGSSYNSFVIKDEKTVLVDTVWNPYQFEFVEMLEKEVGLDNIDMIVINHVEPDHCGSLGYLMSKIPNTPIYCTKQGMDAMKSHFFMDWDFRIVKTGDTINIGENDLVFVDMQMIHWPDSMLTYVKGANVAFSNDAFGQHFAGKSLFNDEVDVCELHQEALKYYANILTPFRPLIKKKIEQILSMNLEIEMIAPSHGIIWRTNPTQIIDKYYEWSKEDYSGDFVVIAYDTMYNGTRNMAEAIGEGLFNKGIKYKMFNTSVSDMSDLNIELFLAKGIIVGSCTVNNSCLTSVAATLHEIKAHRLKNKPAAAFGSYGWSGEAHKVIHKELKEAGMKVELEPIAFKYRPTDADLRACVEFGEKFAQSLKK